ESISSFYAELSRIKQLLNLVKEGTPVLYFLDEILKGTNSADRHKGAVALIKQLIALNVAGFVSTHDLALGELAKEQKDVTNFSFESTIDNGQITFDYKIREGICQSFNASELMRQMGIKV
ncbi:MAG: DNA mismatch repair protein MutS, partial [Bacteroidota bacterium]